MRVVCKYLIFTDKLLEELILTGRVCDSLTDGLIEELRLERGIVDYGGTGGLKVAVRNIWLKGLLGVYQCV